MSETITAGQQWDKYVGWVWRKVAVCPVVYGPFTIPDHKQLSGIAEKLQAEGAVGIVLPANRWRRAMTMMAYHPDPDVEIIGAIQLQLDAATGAGEGTNDDQ